MGFKSKARKKRSAADTAVGRTGKDSKEGFEGQVRCQVAGCENFADKKIGGRRLAFDRAADIWGENGLDGSERRVSICKVHYREWKKEKKDDLNEWS